VYSACILLDVGITEARNLRLHKTQVASYPENVLYQRRIDGLHATKEVGERTEHREKQRR
jgi:hypothetical protein